MNQALNRIQQAFKNRARIAYITAGDGGIEKTYAAANALIAGGVNVLEIGIPFSDPIADGPVIAKAASRALMQGVTIHDIVHLCLRLRQEHPNVVIILFSYYNPILQFLKNDFFAQAKSAGVDGILVVDCPLEEAGPFDKACKQAELCPIYIIAPNTSAERIRQISQSAQGFLYYACRSGTTGIKHALPPDFAEQISRIRSNSHLPIAVGFGIADPQTVQAIYTVADGAVIGSYFVDAIHQGISAQDLSECARQLYGVA
jgi:tryptophan synthase alpha chain